MISSDKVIMPKELNLWKNLRKLENNLKTTATAMPKPRKITIEMDLLMGMELRILKFNFQMN